MSFMKHGKLQRFDVPKSIDRSYGRSLSYQFLSTPSPKAHTTQQHSKFLLSSCLVSLPCKVMSVSWSTRPGHRPGASLVPCPGFSPHGSPSWRSGGPEGNHRAFRGRKAASSRSRKRDGKKCHSAPWFLMNIKMITPRSFLVVILRRGNFLRGMKS